MRTSIATAVICACLVASAALGDEEIPVFSGQPSVQYQVDVKTSQRTRLSPDDTARNVLVIVKIGEDYFWKTRGNRRVIHIIPEAGDAHFFIDPDGGGYVKIMTRPDGTFAYLEQVGLEMTSFIYFGSSRTFTP
ncbi:MAG: hypothetical protein R3F07_01085 [Opitutaceae bacterium]|jgi:hypothetical protein